MQLAIGKSYIQYKNITNVIVFIFIFIFFCGGVLFFEGCIVLFVWGGCVLFFYFLRESNYLYSWRQSSPYKKIQQIQKFNFCTFQCCLVIEWLTDNLWHKFIEKIGALLYNFKMVTGWFMFRFRREPLCKYSETNDDFVYF